MAPQPDWTSCTPSEAPAPGTPRHSPLPALTIVYAPGAGAAAAAEAPTAHPPKATAPAIAIVAAFLSNPFFTAELLAGPAGQRT